MEKNYVDTIKKLVDQYYKHDISSIEYRIKRKRLIDQMDLEFNGVELVNKQFVHTSIDQ